MTYTSSLPPDVRLRSLHRTLVRLEACAKLSSTVKRIDTPHGSVLSCFGLCGNVDARFVPMHARTWEEYSGESEYPIRGGGDMFHSTVNMYDETTDYGRARHRLIAHLIECAKEEIARLENVVGAGEQT